jgi:hypothetical protein
MSTFLKKLIIIFAILVFILFITLIISAWYLGAFASVEFIQEERGPYFIVSTAEAIPYHLIYEQLENISAELDNQGLESGTKAVILQNDPFTSPMNEQRCIAGIIYNDSVTVKSPLSLVKVDKRPVVIALINANPAIAAFKTYPGLSEWLRLNIREYDKSKAIIEKYYEDGHIEVELTLTTY